MGKSHSGFKVGTAVLYRGEIRRPMEILKTKQKKKYLQNGLSSAARREEMHSLGTRAHPAAVD